MYFIVEVEMLKFKKYKIKQNINIQEQNTENMNYIIVCW